MAYASSNFGGNKGCAGEPSGKGSSGGGTYSSKAGSAGARSEPGSSLKGSDSMTTKGNAKKLGGNGR
jgi:hypothetical protein